MNMPRLTAGDSDPIPMQATGQDGAVADLTGSTLSLRARQTRTSTPVPLAHTPLDLSVGTFTWDRVSGELTPGCWQVYLVATRDGVVKTFPTGTAEFHNIEVTS